MADAASPTILLSRRPRVPGADRANARSWLGGAPRLGAAAWPRGRSGAPMHFMAQIDLAEIAAAAPGAPLPKRGSLAFFVGGEGAVRFVSDHMSAPPMEPPADMADLSMVGGDPDWPFDDKGRALFPFWPIDVTRLDTSAPGADVLDGDEARESEWAAFEAAVSKRFVRRKYNLSPCALFAGPPIPDWWRNAAYLADELAAAVKDAPRKIETERNSLAYSRKKLDEARVQGEAAIWEARRVDDQPASLQPASLSARLSRLLFGGKQAAQQDNGLRNVEVVTRKVDRATKEAADLVALYEARIGKMQRLLPELEAFAAEVADWTRGRDHWSLMEPEDLARLGGYWERMIDFPEFTVHYGKTPLDYLKTRMFAKMPRPDDPAVASLPEDVRAVISGRYAPRPQWWRSAIFLAEGLARTLAEGEPRRFAAKRERLAATGVAKAKALADLEAGQAAFQQFVAEFVDWARGRDPWSRMSDEDTASLWNEFSRDYYFTSFERLEAATLVGALAAEDAIFKSVPEAARETVNRDYLLPIDFMHQMFGPPVFIQGDSCAQAEEGKLLLLQLGFDDLMFWSFGDNGCYQFWIAPEDLAREAWDRVTLTFECH